ncbi:MAG: proton-conducting membrane transporter [Lachnospiraceae bacterium]|nr:proton-conducting membrane transporter [Lachnospiraceae bacterium]
MNENSMIVAVLLPMIAGVMIPTLPLKTQKSRNIFTIIAVILTSILVLALVIFPPTTTATFFRFTMHLSVALKLDGLGRLFAALVAILWPLATLYAFEYMEHEPRQPAFFMFYTMVYGSTLGVCMAHNVVTLYFFYELLSVVTLPLIMHSMSKEALKASRSYLYFMFTGAALAFVSLMYLMNFASTTVFVYGGAVNANTVMDNRLLFEAMYICTFFGFGMKTAVFPFCKWLPQAGVAPTPVTALLHAVALVNTGAFAVARMTYYTFGAENLTAGLGQRVCQIAAIITIVYGCSRAVKESHFKRRLAWSTVSNLSYMLFGILLLTPLGLVAGMCHMVCHSFMKIALFFVAGAVNEKTKRYYTYELDGLGRKMPILFTVFTIAGIALMGTPGLCGFVSKWYLAKAAMQTDTIAGYIGVGALLISSLLTAIYIMTIVVRAFFPPKEFDYATLDGITDPGWRMLLPLIIFIVGIVVLGLYSGPLLDYLNLLGEI